MNRPLQAPANIGELIRQSVRSMSSLRLSRSCDHGAFPKEAAFQQLFNQAMTMQLPPGVAVCLELNTLLTMLMVTL